MQREARKTPVSIRPQAPGCRNVGPMMNLDGRHQATRDVARWFAFDHLADGAAQATSRHFHDLAETLICENSDSPELVKALNALLEAKDWAVRATIAALPAP